VGEEPERLRARERAEALIRLAEGPVTPSEYPPDLPLTMAREYLALLAEVERLAGERDEARASLAELLAAYKWEVEDLKLLAGRVDALKAAVTQIAETARWYANNDQRLPLEVDHALCVEILDVAERAADVGGSE
jgi:hypothetical protein